MPISKHLLPDLAAGPGVTLPGTSKDGLRVSLINHLAVASKFCVSGLLRRANLSESTSTFLGVFSILPLRSCSILPLRSCFISVSWDEPAYSSGTVNSSPDSPRANQQGDCSAAGLLSLYGAEPGESNHAEAGAEEPDSGGLLVRAARKGKLKTAPSKLPSGTTAPHSETGSAV